MGNTGKQPKRGRPATKKTVKREKSPDAKTIKVDKQNNGGVSVGVQKKEKVTAYMATFPTRELIIAEAVESLLPGLINWLFGLMVKWNYRKHATMKR